LNELENEEKQLKGKVSTLQLESVQIQDQLLSTETLVQNLLRFRDCTDIHAPQYKPILHTILIKMLIFKDKVIFEFKNLPWPTEMPLETS
jgi:hypothetical protein